MTRGLGVAEGRNLGELPDPSEAPDQPIPRPSVGVVVPTYGHEAFLSAALESVLAQSVADWHAVVVDDGSPDGSGAIADDYARRDPRISVLHQRNAGQSEARNQGARELAEADRLLFCDGDDVLLPNAIEDLTAALDAAPMAAAAHGLAVLIDGEGHRIGDGAITRSQRYHYDADGRSRLTVAPLGLEQLARESIIGPPATVMVDAEKFRRLGGFDPAFSFATDWDMWTRLSRLGGIVTVHREVACWRIHGDNMSILDRGSGYREMRRVRVKTYRSPENSAADRKLLRRVTRHHHMGHVRTAHRRDERGGTLRDLAARTVHLALAAYGRPVAR